MSKIFSSKWFSGPNAFSEGLADLRRVCKPAEDAIKMATDRVVDVGTLMDFVNQVWPGMADSHAKFITCLLSIQALVSPKAFSNIQLQASYDGVRYRTNSGTVFGWRRMKDGRYVFLVHLHGTPAYLERASPQLEANGWKIASRKDAGRFCNLLLPDVPAKVSLGQLFPPPAEPVVESPQL